MNNLANAKDRRMTVREVAEILGVTDEAIKWHTRELYPELMRNGVTTYQNEEQVTAIKQKMIPTSQLVGAITDLEAMEMLAKAGEHFKARYEQEQRARIEAERNIAVLEAKVESDKSNGGGGMSGGLEMLMRNIVIGWMHEAADRGYITVTDGVRLYSTKGWTKTEDGKPSNVNVPFLLERKEERIVFECSDLSDVMDCLDMLYGDSAEGKEHGAKVIPFPIGRPA